MARGTRTSRRHSGRCIAFSVASGRRRRTFLALRLRRREGDVHQFRGAAADGTASQRRTPAVALAPPSASALCSRCPGAMTRCCCHNVAGEARLRASRTLAFGEPYVFQIKLLLLINSTSSTSSGVSTGGCLSWSFVKVSIRLSGCFARRRPALRRRGLATGEVEGHLA